MEGEKNNSFEDLNIFNEISENSFQKTDSDNIKKSKDIYDYIIFYSWVVKIINYLLFIVILLFWTYIFIQKSESFYQNSYLNLFCPIFMGSKASDYISWSDCSSISTYNWEITKKLDGLKQEQFWKIINLIPKIYELKSSNTKEKDFLLSKTRDRLKVLNIIEEFEKLKNDYSYDDRSKIVCKNIEINSENVFKANCEAYSTVWEDEIVWSNWKEKIKGTSISVALSFLNYIQTQSTSFTLTNKQKTFNQESSSVGFYVYKTAFNLEMKYTWDNLSF